MKKVFLLMVVSALLVTLGFAQTPDAATNTDQANVKGCLGGSDGNYTVAEDGTGQVFKITTSSVDLKPHLGQDVKLIGHKGSGVAGSGAANNSFAVTELNMISEHCASAAAAPVGAVMPSSEPVITPAATAAGSNTDQAIVKGCLGGSDGSYTVAEDGTGQIFKITTSSVDLKPHLSHDVKLVGHKGSGTGPGAADNSFAVTELNMISEHCTVAAAAPVGTVMPSSETVITPAADAAAPSVTASTPTAGAAAPAATVSPSSATVSTPPADAAHPTRPLAHPRKLSATQAAAATAPAATVSPSSETVSTPAADAATPAADAAIPAATASPSSETTSTPGVAATAPTVTRRGGSLWLLILFAVLVIVLGTLTPVLGRWRKRKILERTDAPNLSFTNEASADEIKPEPRKVA